MSIPPIGWTMLEGRELDEAVRSAAGEVASATWGTHSCTGRVAVTHPSVWILAPRVVGVIGDGSPDATIEVSVGNVRYVFLAAHRGQTADGWCFAWPAAARRATGPLAPVSRRTSLRLADSGEPLRVVESSSHSAAFIMPERTRLSVGDRVRMEISTEANGAASVVQFEVRALARTERGTEVARGRFLAPPAEGVPVELDALGLDRESVNEVLWALEQSLTPVAPMRTSAPSRTR